MLHIALSGSIDACERHPERMLGILLSHTRLFVTGLGDKFHNLIASPSGGREQAAEGLLQAGLRDALLQYIIPQGHQSLRLLPLDFIVFSTSCCSVQPSSHPNLTSHRATHLASRLYWVLTQEVHSRKCLLLFMATHQPAYLSCWGPRRVVRPCIVACMSCRGLCRLCRLCLLQLCLQF